MQTTDDRKMVSLPEFARALGISRSHAYKEAKQGNILGVPVIRVGRRLILPREAAERVLRGETACERDAG